MIVSRRLWVVPAKIDDDHVPAVRQELLLHIFRIGHYFVFGDAVAKGIIAVPSHRWRGSKVVEGRCGLGGFRDVSRRICGLDRVRMRPELRARKDNDGEYGASPRSVRSDACSGERSERRALGAFRRPCGLTDWKASHFSSIPFEKNEVQMVGESPARFGRPETPSHRPPTID